MMHETYFKEISRVRIQVFSIYYFILLAEYTHFEHKKMYFWMLLRGRYLIFNRYVYI